MDAETRVVELRDIIFRLERLERRLAQLAVTVNRVDVAEKLRRFDVMEKSLERITKELFVQKHPDVREP